MNTLKALVWTIRTQLLPNIRGGAGLLSSCQHAMKMFNSQRQLPKRYQKWGGWL